MTATAVAGQVPAINPGQGIIHPGPMMSWFSYADRVSIMEFGAAGSNNTDDSALFTQANTSLAGTGVALYVPQGTYSVTTGQAMNIPVIVHPGAILDTTKITGITRPFWCRAKMTTVQAYGGSGTGTLTETSNGAISAADGVTLAVGDVVFMEPGLSNVTAKDAGPYLVTALGGASAKWVLTRPWWFPQGGYLGNSSTPIDIGSEGTAWANTQWKGFAAYATVIGTTDCAFYVGRVTKAQALTSSTATISTIGVFSATLSNVLCTIGAAGGTQTSTIGYGPIAAVTPGYSGTASIVIDAIASGFTKNGTADTSTVNCSIINW